MTDIQKIILDTISMTSKSALDSMNFTRSWMGRVYEQPIGQDCLVEKADSILKATIPIGLVPFIGKSNIVVVQDLFNDGSQRIVIGSVSDRKSPLQIYDTIEGIVISSVLDIWLESEGRVISVDLDAYSVI